MNTAQALLTAFEVTGCVALIIALFNERRIAILERRMFRKLKRKFIKRAARSWGK